MTGYSIVTDRIQLSSCGSVAITVELKTLNGRFFEAVCKLSGIMSRLEIPITMLLQEKLVRGRVFISVRFGEAVSAIEPIAPAWTTIDQYMKALQEIKHKHVFAGDITLGEFVSLPNVFMAQDGSLSPDDEKTILTLIASVADKVIKIRTQEGMRLEKDFERMFALCAAKIADVEKNFEHIINQHKETIRQAIADNPHPEEASLHVEEMQVTLRKMDIHEEITRFKSHIDSITTVLKASQLEKGKRLDFVLQELLRETNTMMAKCPAYPISTACIDVKVELEKAREQIQNIV